MRLDSNDYSVHPAVIEVTEGLAQVRVLCDGQAVADHQRIWARHQRISDPLTRPRPAPPAGRRLAPGPPEPEVQIRALAGYDAALGVDGGVA